MKYRKDEIPFIIEFYNKDSKELGIDGMKAKPHFSGIINFYLNSVKDSVYGQVQIKKAKYLLGKNSKEELRFQKEIFIDMVNKILALPDEKLALSNKADANKFMVENYNGICMLLMIEKLVGQQFNDGALRDFSIPPEAVDALKHKRDLLDPSKDVKPDAKYDGIYLNKNDTRKIFTETNAVDIPVEGHKQLQRDLSAIPQYDGRLGRDSFDDFIDGLSDGDTARYLIDQDADIPRDKKREFEQFFSKLNKALSMVTEHEFEYGPSMMVFNPAKDYKPFTDLVMAVKEMPRELIDSVPQSSKAYVYFTNMYNKFVNADVYKKPDTMVRAIQKKSLRTLYANLDVLRSGLDKRGYNRSITDSELVSKVHNYLLANPDSHSRECVGMALDHIAMSGRTVSEELDYQIQIVKQYAAKAERSADWGKVAKGIAKIELLRKKKEEAKNKNIQDPVLDFNELENGAIELLKANPNISLNVSMHDKELIDEYFQNSSDFLNNFKYRDPKIDLMDLNSEYQRFRQDVVRQRGEEPDYLPEDKVFGELDPVSIKAYDLYAKEQRKNNFASEILSSYGMGIPKGWERLEQYFFTMPNSKEDVLKNHEFFCSFIENKVVEGGLTFRQKLLKDSIETLKKLDAADLSGLDDEKIIDNWPGIIKTWGLAFVAKVDLLDACAAEGLEVSDEDKAALKYMNDQATFIYQSIGMRKDRLCNRYTPLAKDIPLDVMMELDFDYSYGDRMSVIQTNGLNAEEGYPDLSAKNMALVKAGISGIRDVLHTKFVSYDAKNNPKEEPFSFDKVVNADKKTFSLTEPGKDTVFYHYDGKGSYIQAKSLEQMNEFLKPHDVTVHIDTNKEYDIVQYIDAFSTAHEELMDKIRTGANITREDIARSLVMQDINIKLRNHADNEDDYHIALQSFVNEDYIKSSIDAVMANPAFDRFIDKMGGLDDQGFIRRQNQQNYISINALKDYQQINADIIQGKEVGGWNNPLDKEASLAKIEEYKKLLENDYQRLKMGGVNEAVGRCTENVFRIALLQKNIDENLGMTTKEIEDKANDLAFNPKLRNIKDSIIPFNKIVGASTNLISPRDGEYPWAKRVYKLLDRCEEVRKPEFETDDQFVARKLSGVGIADENVIKNAKEEFSKLSRANNLLRYSNPDKALSNEDLWKIQTDEKLSGEHDIATQQLKNLRWNDNLKDKGFKVKQYLKRNFYENVKKGHAGLEKIKEEKAKALLGDNTGEALQFQKEFVTDMINKMLALPDDMLAMHGTPEARQYYTEHYNELCMLFEVEHFMGGKKLEGGVRQDFDIPQEIVDVLRHKKNLAQESMLGEEGYIKSLGSKNYRLHSIIDKADANELGLMQTVPGEFGAETEISSITGQVILSRRSKSQKESAAKPDKKYDNFHLDPDDIKIKARFERELTLDDFTDRFDNGVDRSQITVNDKFEALNQKLMKLKDDFSSKLKEGDKAKVFEDLRKSCDEYVSSLVTQQNPFSSLSEADKDAVNCVKKIADLCKNKQTYHTMKENVFRLETELGIKDHELDLKMNPEGDYDRRMYDSIITENRKLVEGVAKKEIRNRKSPDRDIIARLYVLDTLQKQIKVNNYPAEYVKSFLSEDYIQHNVDSIKNSEEFRTFLSENTMTEKLVGSDLSGKLHAPAHERHVEKVSDKPEKNSDFSKHEELEPEVKELHSKTSLTL